jgi:hypothetical protein
MTLALALVYKNASGYTSHSRRMMESGEADL